MVRRPLALVTGASSGIGLELARELAGDGHDPVIAARNVAALEALAAELRGATGAEVTIIATDLLEPAAPALLLAELAERGLVIDVLINNAGFGDGAQFHSADRATVMGMIQVNVAALTELMHGLLGPMVARRSGRILNVASTAAFQPGPNMAVYCATKAYVLSLTEAVAEEVRRHGVTVTALCPGATRTNFMAVADIADNPLFAKGMIPVMTAGAVARLGYQGLKRGQAVVVTGWVNQISALSPRLFPRSVVRKVAGALLARAH